MTKLTNNEIFRASSVDLLVGGTPCQSFSVAGLRGGLADPRGNLMLTFLSLADAKKPRWILWENVPGVLSSNGGKDFGTFLGALGELGYGFAYRVLDAQYFGVAQRRRRVFVVGYLGDWRCAAAVLFEQESLFRDFKKGRKKREKIATDAETGIGNTGKSWWDGGQTAGTLTKKNADGGQRMPDKDNFRAVIEQVAQPIAYSFDSLSSNSMKSNNPNSGCREVDTSKTIDTTIPEPSKNQGGIAIVQPIPIHDQATRFEGKRGNKQDGKGNGLGIGNEGDVMNTLTKGDKHAVAQPIAVDWRTAQVDVEKTGTLKTDLAKMSGPCIAVDVYNQTIDGQIAATITAEVGGTNTSGPKIAQPIAVDTYNQTINENTSQTIGSSRSDENHIGAVLQTMAIRRLTPKECERLQGFPDDWTKIPYRNKPADQCPDGPRYKACGNSMAVPVMRWIGKRIQLIDTIIN